MGAIDISHSLRKGIKALFSLTGLQSFLIMLPGFLVYNIGVRGYIPGSYKYLSSTITFNEVTSILIIVLGFILYFWSLIGVIRSLNYGKLKIEFFFSNLSKAFLNLTGAALIIGLIYSSFATPFYLSQFISVTSDLNLALSVLGALSLSFYILILNPLIIYSLFFVVIERKNFITSIKYSLKLTKGNRTKCIILNILCLILSTLFISLLFIVIIILEFLMGLGGFLMFGLLIPGYLVCCLMFISVFSESFKQLTKR